jgi:hypothetical protein
LLFKTPGLQVQEVTFAELDSREKPKVNPSDSTSSSIVILFASNLFFNNLFDYHFIRQL